MVRAPVLRRSIRPTSTNPVSLAFIEQAIAEQTEAAVAELSGVASETAEAAAAQRPQHVDESKMLQAVRNGPPTADFIEKEGDGRLFPQIGARFPPRGKVR